ncbi:hypothetical protein C8A00DRAFT_14788 [Chaetomidium leptoderma]|uniref:Uncharacterized protein n=1 Tax=Chaetomidium leptoderma TaxID=669021 RepID=A0AAN6ZXN4_9PEZI|nr:hypothetical protein C8A00DRAFT_14788 [Chaetomidium leptoderma]
MGAKAKSRKGSAARPRRGGRTTTSRDVRSSRSRETNSPPPTKALETSSSVARSEPSVNTADTENHDTRVRRCQNRVGKRYRDKQTAEFENLQVALRLDDLMDAGGTQRDGSKEQSTPHRRRRPVNKAKIIDLARERLGVLVRDWEAVKVERDALLRERAVEGGDSG